MPGYIRHDSNNNPAGTQPTKIIVNELGGTTGWSTVVSENFNGDYIAYTYNSNAGVGTRTPASYQRHDENNQPVGVGTYQRHDINNNPITSP
tara:strand:+ start:788 stop:1063 length:276 start_codon:yes stop_codon:yes gene_type:complete